MFTPFRYAWVLLTVVLGNPSNAQEPVGDRFLSGRVLDGAGVPVANAEVIVAAEDDQGVVYSPRSPRCADTLRVASNAIGDFRVALPDDGDRWLIVVEAAGHAPRCEHDLRADDDIVVVLGPGASMHGQILDSQGNPVVGAELHWFALHSGSVPERFAVSDTGGRYHLDDLPRPISPSQWFVIVNAEGFAPLKVELSGWPSPPVKGLVHRSEREWVQHFVLERGATLSGRVRDEITDEPIHGAEVVLWSLEGRKTFGDGWTRTSNPYGDRVLARTRTAEDGSYRFDHVPVDGFHGNASNNGTRKGRLLGSLVAHTGDRAVKEDVFLLRDGEERSVPLWLPPEGQADRNARAWVGRGGRGGPRAVRPPQRPMTGTQRLRGQCVDPRGRPVRNAQVSAWKGELTEQELNAVRAVGFFHQNWPLGYNTVRADGMFELRNLPEGPLWLVATNRASSVTLRVEEPWEFVAIELAADDSDAENTSLVLEGVQDADSEEPLKPRHLFAVPEDVDLHTLGNWEYWNWRSGPAERAHEVGGGRFAIVDLDPGRWVLYAQCEGYAVRRQPGLVTEGGIVLHPPLLLQPAGEIRGTVRGMELARGHTVRLHLEREGGGAVAANVLEGGSFSAGSLGPGHYRASATCTTPEGEWVPVYLDGPRIFVVVTGSPLTMVEWTLAEGREVTIEVVDPVREQDGPFAFGPVDGLQVRIETAAGELVSRIGLQYRENRLTLPPNEDFVARFVHHGEELGEQEFRTRPDTAVVLHWEVADPGRQ